MCACRRNSNGELIIAKEPADKLLAFIDALSLSERSPYLEQNGGDSRHDGPVEGDDRNPKARSSTITRETPGFGAPATPRCSGTSIDSSGLPHGVQPSSTPSSNRCSMIESGGQKETAAAQPRRRHGTPRPHTSYPPGTRRSDPAVLRQVSVTGHTFVRSASPNSEAYLDVRPDFLPRGGAMTEPEEQDTEGDICITTDTLNDIPQLRFVDQRQTNNDMVIRQDPENRVRVALMNVSDRIEAQTKALETGKRYHVEEVRRILLDLQEEVELLRTPNRRRPNFRTGIVLDDGYVLDQFSNDDDAVMLRRGPGQARHSYKRPSDEASAAGGGDDQGVSEAKSKRQQIRLHGERKLSPRLSLGDDQTTPDDGDSIV